MPYEHLKVYPDRTPEVKIGNASVYEFSEAEIKVLRLLVDGMTYKEMGEQLGVTSDCVKSTSAICCLKQASLPRLNLQLW